MVVDGEQLPLKIEHFVDTDMDAESGQCSYNYNYLLYTFDHPTGIVSARSYLDEAKTVSLVKHSRVDDLEKTFPEILKYLRRRYETVMRLGSLGYQQI